MAPELEHLWIEIPDRNRHSKMLLCVLYCSYFIQDFHTWIDTAESLFSQLNVVWDGLLLVTGDVNVDMLTPVASQVRKYCDMLISLKLYQHITKPTRTTPTSKTLIDHIISNTPNRIAYCNVLPCPTISDHDALYACINIWVTHFQTRYKLLSNEKHFNKAKFKEDLGGVPFSTVYGVGEPNQKLDVFNSLFKSCLDRHAPLCRTKITRPPAPWLNEEEIRKLQRERSELRHLAHQIKSPGIWEKFSQSAKQNKNKNHKF